MLATLTQHTGTFNHTTTQASHILVILPKLERIPKTYDIPYLDTLKNILTRRDIKLSKLSKKAISANLENGALCVWSMVDTQKSIFEQQTAVRKAVQLLLTEEPVETHLLVYGNANQKKHFAELAVYATWVNGAALPIRKSSSEKKILDTIHLHGHTDPDNFTQERARAEGNLLARGLTVLPPNELTPKAYREQIKKLASSEGWEYQEFDLDALKDMNAGAFTAVAQGSDAQDAAIVHLKRYSHADNKTIALVGKGICFDTGGHNLKPARYMLGMHEDMNGSAVSLGILLAVTRADLPVNIDCWLAIAQNHISPAAYKQNDVITALNGLTIEIVHTDAEGRMVLADTLTLAEEQKPDMLIDFATLTGSMHTALGSRYSGIFSNLDNLAQKAITAGQTSGERVCAFPLDKDYEESLESDIADTKQCTVGGEADHILAACFLSKFISSNTPWIHMDLSASSHKGGLGAVGSDITGFGVGWAIELIQEMTRNKR